MNDRKVRHQNSCRRVFLDTDIRNFRRGKNGDWIFVLADSSERNSEILYRTKVRRKSRDRNGYYLGRGKGKYYDVDSGTIDGRRVYLFRPSQQLRERWKRQQAEKELLQWALASSEEDCIALSDLVREQVGERPLWPRRKEGALETLEAFIGSLSLSAIEELLDLLSVTAEGSRSSSHPRE